MLKLKGLTLVELMIALLIAAIVIAGVMSVFVSVIRHSHGDIELGRLDSNLHKVVGTIARDVGRAGYWANSETSATNPFTQSGTDISVNAANNCLLITYDHNDDGSLPSESSGSDDERYGYRLMNGAIQYRPNNASFDCAASSASWTNMTDPNVVTITNFSVTKNTLTNANIEIRTITLSITGQLVSDTAITKTITQTIKVQNDRYAP